ncbi:DUF2972 domain-containing protein, partial [Campylobacter insulaenigrae]|uniref:DUF2972 domain-containing protein n=1 Tax=Campylobacter insulaenigrae TaxID=260714 RepID=UPI0021533827
TGGHAVGRMAVTIILNKYINVIQNIKHKDFKIKYLDYYQKLTMQKTSDNVLCITEFFESNRTKFFKILDKNKQKLFLVRDPISMLRTGINLVEYTNASSILNINNDKFDDYIVQFDPLYCITDRKLTISAIATLFIADLFEYSNIYYLDMQEINQKNSFNTFLRISKELNFRSPRMNDYDFISERKHATEAAHFIPIKIEIYRNIFIYLHFKYMPYFTNMQKYTDITDLFNDFYLYGVKIQIIIDNENISILNDEELIKKINIFLKKLNIYLNSRINENLKKKYSDYDILNMLKNENMINIAKQILDRELAHIKQHRPDIVASWKYYQEFEKMCEELDGK